GHERCGVPSARIDTDVFSFPWISPDEAHRIRVDEREAVYVPRNGRDHLRQFRPIRGLTRVDEALNIDRRCGRRVSAPARAHSERTKRRDRDCAGGPIAKPPTRMRPEDGAWRTTSLFEQPLDRARVLGTIGWVIG